MNEQQIRLTNEIRREAAERRCREERFLSAEKTVKLIGASYAVYAAAAAVLSLVYPTAGYHALSVMLTVMLSLIVAVLCAQKYESRAQRLKGDCATLMRLQREAEAADSQDTLASVERQLAELLAAGESVGAHERRAAIRQISRRAEEAKGLSGYEKFLFWFVEITGMTLIAAMLLLPIAGIVLAACGVI